MTCDSSIRRMKTIFLTVILAAAFFLPGCQSDDDSSGTSIAGSWQVQSKETFDCTLAADNELTCGTYAFCYTITFNSDETFEMERTSDGGFLGSGTFYFAADHFTITFTQNPAGFADLQAVPAVISGNTLTTTQRAGAAKRGWSIRKTDISGLYS
jgi:hypothetical protein